MYPCVNCLPSAGWCGLMCTCVKLVRINTGGRGHDGLDSDRVQGHTRGTVSRGLESGLFCREAGTLGIGPTAGFDLSCCRCLPPFCPSPHVCLSYLSVRLCLPVLHVKFCHCYLYGEWDVQIIKCGLMFSLDWKPRYFSSDQI